MGWILRKLREPSTWKGLGWLLVAVGIVPIGSVDALVSAGIAVVGAVEVMRKEMP
jgi:hypothetical protein